MDMYKFGNYICRLREEKGMTQTELSFKLDVSDMTVSKWENGQAFPRIETFERLAQVLGTTMQDILSASRDGVRRVCFVNEMCPVLQIEVDGVLAVLRHGECKWLEVESEEIILKLWGDGEPVLTPPAEREASAGTRFWNKALRMTEQLSAKMCLHTECTYRVSHLQEDSFVIIGLDIIETEDPTWIFPPFNMDYPLVRGVGIGVELLRSRPMNRRDAISAYKKMGLVWAIGEHPVLMVLLLPFLGLFARYQCRRRIIEKRIRTIDAVREREQRSEKKLGRRLGVAVAVVILFMVIGLWLAPKGIGRTYEIAEDYSVITCEGEVYTRISSLPEDAEPVLYLGAEVWDKARVESGSFWDFLEQDFQVQVFEDPQGRRYLWLVEDYAETMLPEDGSEPDYDDFSEHKLYGLQ